MTTLDHITFMTAALKEAAAAGTRNEVPVGAVLVSDAGAILAAAHNFTIRSCDHRPMPRFWRCARRP